MGQYEPSGTYTHMIIDDTLYESDGILIVRELCSPLMIQSIKRYLHTKINSKIDNDDVRLNDGQCAHRVYLGRLKYIDSILHESAAILSNIIGESILPTYSYPVINLPGNVLYRHTDRPACEFTASLTVDSYPNGYIWPLYVETINKRDVCVLLNPGDLVLYSGTKRPHWRNRLPEGCFNISIFFHFVREHGELSNWHKRESIIPAQLDPYEEIHEKMLMKQHSK